MRLFVTCLQILHSVMLQCCPCGAMQTSAYHAHC
uniref:Uncharacterized protein n=1 Tax=Ulva partita TaxID=1605170 RepID=A0A1C9ZQB4_9CHLO|nr:hypothetical protein [Ulva partita]